MGGYLSLFPWCLTQSAGDVLRSDLAGAEDGWFRGEKRENGGFQPGGALSPIQNQGNFTLQFMEDGLGIRGRDSAKTVGARCGERETNQSEKLLRYRVSGVANGDRIQPRSDFRWHFRSTGEHQSEWARPKCGGQVKGLTRNILS